MNAIKNVLVLMTVLTNFGAYAEARCDENDLTELARGLDISGIVETKRGKSTEENTIVKLLPGNRTYREFEEFVSPKKYEILSPVFGVEGEELMAVVREKSTCAVIMYGTDGEDVGRGLLKDMSRNSVSYEIEGVLYSITKK